LSGDPGGKRTWWRSGLVRRLERADMLNRGMLFAAILLLCFVPFVIVLQSLVGRERSIGVHAALRPERARGPRGAAGPDLAVRGPRHDQRAELGLLHPRGLAAAAAIQELYERVFEVEGRGFRDTPRRVAWLVVALDFSLLASLVQSWLHDAGGIVLVAVVALVGATAFWWFPMWLLLAGKQPWRALLPSALATGICWVGMVTVFRLTMSSTIISNYRKCGPTCFDRLRL